MFFRLASKTPSDTFWFQQFLTIIEKMEVGAVKQAFNNEVILLKKNLNQAKIQIIHKLTRKAKTLAEKKIPEKLKGKFTKKAESAVKEVLILKKIKARDVARFIVTHKGQLNEYLNKPTVDKEKACARLLLHKALQSKYKMLRDKFSNVPIEDLLMSRQERLKRKKEEREKQKSKKKGKEGNGPIQAEGDWDVEDINMSDIQVRNESDEDSESSNDSQYNESENDMEDSDVECNSHINNINNSDNNDNDDNTDRNIEDSKKSRTETAESSDEEVSDNEPSNRKIDDGNTIGKFVKFIPTLPDNNALISKKPVDKIAKVKENISNKKLHERHKDSNKNKNLKNKILLKKFNKDRPEVAVQENKVVDPFFITATGENYLSLAEPRLPDEVKEEHSQGNRKYRRAVMFGHAPKGKPRRNDFGPKNSETKFNKFNDSQSRDNSNTKFKSNGFEKQERFNKSGEFSRKSNFNDKRSFDEQPKPEKLHPSWEAKKRQSGILPFQGKKIVFDEG